MTRRFSFSLPESTGSYYRTILAAFSILSVLVTLYRLPSEFPRPFKPGPRILTAGIWTLHFGIDNVGRDSQRGVRDVIRYIHWLLTCFDSQRNLIYLFRDMQLDIVGLLETDLHVSLLEQCSGSGS